MVTVLLMVVERTGDARFHGDVVGGASGATKTTHFCRKGETDSGQQIRQERDRRAQSNASLRVTHAAHAVSSSTPASLTLQPQGRGETPSSRRAD
jgi:hypothetical protein